MIVKDNVKCWEWKKLTFTFVFCLFVFVYISLKSVVDEPNTYRFWPLTAVSIFLNDAVKINNLHQLKGHLQIAEGVGHSVLALTVRVITKLNNLIYTLALREQEGLLVCKYLILI